MPLKPIFDLAGRRVFVAGHNGMVGAAIVRRLTIENCEILTVGRDRLDLSRQADTEDYLAEMKPDVVIVAAARVGGILANSMLPANFIAENLAIAQNLIGAAHKSRIGKLLFLGSSCIYPRLAEQPITEEMLLTGLLEPTNEWYAIAKIAGIKLCQAYRRQYGCDFISLMPTNLYGPGDNYHPEHSHVPAALISRMHNAKVSGTSEVVIWGTGKAMREFLFVDDLADACVFSLKHYSAEDFLNVGSSEEVSIATFAERVAEAVGYTGWFVFDTLKPDGAPRKLLDSSRLTRLGWTASTGLREGLAAAYADFLARSGGARVPVAQSA